MLGCEQGHRFDVNRRGYLTLPTPRGIDGDPRELLERRAAFLAAGHFSPVADAIAGALPAGPETLRVLDSGCGTGYYAQQLLTTGRLCALLALDVSPTAVAMTLAATRTAGARDAAGLVADVWSPLPVRDSVADVILCVFAPRNPAEFARILAPRGRLVVVTPAPDHLRELREQGAVIGMREGKHHELVQAMAPALHVVHREHVVRALQLDELERSLLAGMGPSGHHALPRTTNAATVTLSVDVTAFERL